jgi:4-amino-4-deoxy-L-arabinose transferase-like glycosyltransferase
MDSVFTKLIARPQTSLVVLCLVLFLAGNWILPLTDRDEARFSEASREMIQRSDYVVPWFNGGWRLYKPALIYWCQIASYRVLGINAFAARLPSALFTTATALLLLRWGRKIADNKAGFMAGAMYAAGLHVGFIGRMATADLALVFFFTLAVWSGWELTRPEQPHRKQWWLIFYVALALGFLAKGPEAWLPLMGMILGRAFRKNAFRLRASETVAGLCLALVLVGLWGIPAIEQTHGEYWRFGMGDQVFNRAVGVKDSHGVAGILGFVALLPLYFLTFFISFFPWSTRVPSALRRWWPERSRDDLGWYLFVQALIVFVVFSLVRTKLPHYTLPAFPCLALWLALQLWLEKNSFNWFQRRLIVMIGLVLVVMLGLTSIAKKHFLTENIWQTAQPHMRANTKVGCFGYTEPSLVWEFRAVTTNLVVLGNESDEKNFLTNMPPFILVLPTKDVASLGDTNGLQIQVQGLDMVKFKNWDLTEIVR